LNSCSNYPKIQATAQTQAQAQAQTQAQAQMISMAISDDINAFSICQEDASKMKREVAILRPAEEWSNVSEHLQQFSEKRDSRVLIVTPEQYRILTKIYRKYDYRLVKNLMARPH
jgi:hypothetical protein